MALFNISPKARRAARQSKADEEARSALLNHIKSKSPDVFENYGLSDNTSLRGIQTALSIGERLDALSAGQQESQFLRPGSSRVVPPQGPRDPLAQASGQGQVDPATLVQAAQQLGVPPELQQSRAAPIDIHSAGGVGPNAPLDLLRQQAEKSLSANIDVAKTGETENIRNQTDVKKSQLSSQFNLNLVAENMFDLGELLVSAYQEGGAGNIVSAGLTEAAIRGFLPEGLAERYAKSSAVPGKKIEIISKMFPVLTSQIGKEGSVRLIESVFTKLGKSLPGLQTAPKLAVEQMDASIQTMFRINRALESIDLEEFDLTTKAGESNFTERVSREAKAIKLSAQQRKDLEALKSASLEPLRNYIKERDDSGKTSGAGKSERLAEIRKRRAELEGR